MRNVTNGDFAVADSTGTNNKESTIKVNPHATVSVSRPNSYDMEEGRRLAYVQPSSKTGDHTVLVVRVTSGSFAPDDSVSTIGSNVFSDSLNLVSEKPRISSIL